MTLRACTGPNGEPGWQVEVGDTTTECFIYDPADVMSKIRAEQQVLAAFDQLETSRVGTEAPM